jgi:putative MATE family efflux protein
LSDREATPAIVRPAGRALRTGTAARAEALGSSLGMLETTWALAWPAIISFSLESIVSLCDLLMVGHLGPASVAAVGVGVQILNALNTTLFAIGTGALAIVARHVGAGERRPAEETLRQSVVAAALSSALFALPIAVFARSLVGVFRVEPAVVDETVRFLRVVLASVPGVGVVFVTAASLRAAGDTRTPLAVGIVVSVLNIALGFILIFGRLGLPALGVRGAGAATTIAFTIGACLGLWLLARGHLRLVVRWPGFRFHGAVVRRVLRVGYPAALEQLLMQLGFFTYVIFVARYGTGPVAAYFIGARVLALSFLPGLGFAAAAGALVGQNLGASRPDDAERSGWAAQRLALLMMSAAGAAIFVAATPIAGLFVADPAVIEDAASFIRVLAVCQPLMAFDFVMGGALRGAGDTRFPLLTAIVAFWVCRLGAAWLVTHVLGLDLFWLWRVVILDFAARATLKTWRFRAGTWRHARV